MATSPPGPSPSSLPNPKKRPSIGAHSLTSQSSKRPKLHPLRQTSFPVTANDASAFYASAGTSARSETGSVANSLVSGVSGSTTKRGRGRPRKSTQLHEDDIRASQTQQSTTGGDTGSQVDGSTTRNTGRGTKSVVSARSGGGGGADDDDDEGDIDGMIDRNMDESDRARADEEDARQAQRRDRLTSTFDADQERRYGQWRAVTLNKGMLRRIVNQTVSQSVTAAPLQAVNIYSKWFVGELIERARDVQIEYAKAYDETRSQLKRIQQINLQQLQDRHQTLLQQPSPDHIEARRLSQQIANLKSELDDEYIPNPHRGGLLPDHLREALRRYKADGEGGGVGFEGLSHGLLGTQGAGSWRTGDGAVGRRLFR